MVGLVGYDALPPMIPRAACHLPGGLQGSGSPALDLCVLRSATVLGSACCSALCCVPIYTQHYFGCPRLRPWRPALLFSAAAAVRALLLRALCCYGTAANPCCELPTAGCTAREGDRWLLEVNKLLLWDQTELLQREPVLLAVMAQS